MFSAAKAFGSFAVDDLAAARKFYGQTLGLQVSQEDGPLMLHFAPLMTLLAHHASEHALAPLVLVGQTTGWPSPTE